MKTKGKVKALPDSMDPQIGDVTSIYRATSWLV